jgi:hypothetical protein
VPKKNARETKELTAVAPPLDTGRVEQVVRWIAGGASESEIVEAIRHNWPEAEQRPLIIAALTQIAEQSQAQPDLVLGWCLQSTRELHRRMVEVGDFTGALRAIKLLAELQQLL